MNRKLNTAVYCLAYSLIFTAGNLTAGDTLIMKGNKTFTGTFQTFKTDKIYFLPANGGKIMREQRLYVESLTIDPPSKVLVTPKGKKKIEDMKLTKYSKSNFIFDKNGEEISIPGAQISSIEMGLDFGRAAGGAGDQQDGSDAENKPLKINLNDLSAFVKENGSTPEQIKVFEQYKTARVTYDTFLDTSSAMVKSMDKTTGTAREDFLNKLRKRKNDEQPILGKLKKAEQELLASFPEIKVAK